MSTYENLLKQQLDSMQANAVRDLEKRVRDMLDKCGLFYKCFIRVKTAKSAISKINRKIEEGKENYKLQDIIGMRIVVYFKKDILLCEELIQNSFTIDNVSKDAETTDQFKPQRINYVCYLPEDIKSLLSPQLWELHVDSTFEIQIRTIFSEGWHEVEHDFRYKSKSDWENHDDLSRTLNGIFATLDTCDWAIENLLNEVSYRHYKSQNWIPMLKNIFRIRIQNDGNMQEILDYFNHSPEIAKAFYRIDREALLKSLSVLKVQLPLNLDNLVYVANYVCIHDDKIDEMTPDAIKVLLQM